MARAVPGSALSLPSPLLTRFCQKLKRTQPRLRLALACSGSTAQRIDIPKPGVNRKVLNSDFPGQFGSGSAAPNDAELRFGAQVHHVNHVSRFQLSVYALQGSPASTNAAQTGGLSEGAGMNVHAPDLDRKINENARLAAPVHAMLLGFKWGSRNRRRAGGGNIGNLSHRRTCAKSLVT